MSRKISKSDQSKLVGSLKDVVDHVDNGNMAPTDAIVKVAQDNDLSVAHVRLLSTTYNNGRAARQRDENDDLFGKLAHFPLADADEAVKKLYPSDVVTKEARLRETAVSDEYDRDPDWIKEARVLRVTRQELDEVGLITPPQQKTPPSLGYLAEKAAQLYSTVERTEEAMFAEWQDAKDKFDATMGKLAAHFRKEGQAAFEEVRYNSDLVFGPATRPLFHSIEVASEKWAEWHPDRHMKPLTKQASDDGYSRLRDAIVNEPEKRASTHAVVKTQSPYADIKAAIEYANASTEKFAELVDFSLNARTQLQLLRDGVGGVQPCPPASNRSILQMVRGEKRASFLETGADIAQTGMEMGVANELGGSILKKILPEDKEKLEGKAFMQMFDPAHEATLRSIRAKANLASILQSPYFTGEDPRKVVDLYNHVVRMAPRLGENPMGLEAAMRQYASQGQVGVHDVDQLAGIEGKLKQQREMPKGGFPTMPTAQNIGKQGG